MKTCKNIIIILLTVLLVVLFLIDIFAVLHSMYFTFTHIHLTRMESILDPGNHIGLKLLAIAATWVDFKILTAIAENS